MAICNCCVQKIENPIKCWFSEFDKMKQKSEGIGLVVGRVQRIEEEAANASLKVTMMMVIMMMTMFVTIMILGLDVLFLNPWRRPKAKGKCSRAMMPLTLKSGISGQSSMSLSKMDLFRDGGNYVLEPRAHACKGLQRNIYENVSSNF